MPDAAEPAADVEIRARVTAHELRFQEQPELRIAFPGTDKRDSRQTTKRRNISSPIRPGKAYRRVFAATRISSRVVDVSLLRPPGDRRHWRRSSGGSRRAATGSGAR